MFRVARAVGHTLHEALLVVHIRHEVLVVVHILRKEFQEVHIHHVASHNPHEAIHTPPTVAQQRLKLLAKILALKTSAECYRIVFKDFYQIFFTISLPLLIVQLLKLN